MAAPGTDEAVGRAEALGERINGRPEALAEVVPQLLDMLGRCESDEELVAVISALGHAWREDASMAVVRFAGHLNGKVRLEVARTAGNGIESPEGWAQVLPALLRLAQDELAEVRDWATFEMARSDLDLPLVRDALALRMADPHYDTRCEALVGLAERSDARALRPVADALAAESVGSLVVEAAGYLGEPSLVPLLEDLVDWWDVDPGLLTGALAACRSSEPTVRWDGEPRDWIYEI